LDVCTISGEVTGDPTSLGYAYTDAVEGRSASAQGATLALSPGFTQANVVRFGRLDPIPPNVNQTIYEINVSNEPTIAQILYIVPPSYAQTIPGTFVSGAGDPLR
jgi:hypothetical protein